MTSLAALVLLRDTYTDLELTQWFAFKETFLSASETPDGKLVCHYCGRDDLLREIPEGKVRQPANLATLDHVVPVSKGGAREDPDNVVIACYSCNQKKADKEDWEADCDKDINGCKCNRLPKGAI